MEGLNKGEIRGIIGQQKLYKDLKPGSLFNVPFNELRLPIADSDVSRKFGLGKLQDGSKRVVIFVKESDTTCREIITGKVFALGEKKGVMVNEETGIFFYYIYVDTSVKPPESRELIISYFEAAERHRAKGPKMTLEKKDI